GADVTVVGNYIGTNAVGDNLGGTGSAISISSATAATIGGTNAGEGNVIANYTGDGISVTSATSGYTFLGNSIYSNGDLGIDLGTSGVTANDTGDADTGANNLQNFPVLGSAVTDGSSQITITGTLNSLANSYFRIEFFASNSGDASGYGEGQTYLGYANVATDGSGNATINAVLSASVPTGAYVSATATKSDASYTSFGGTSEFSANVVATGA
ncbi:MAG: hypothetical protein KDA96_28370, partial [Planctomycetaceae bacterium]|nr:hypothetical protein [Planctomycetaceae bacterium]